MFHFPSSLKPLGGAQNTSIPLERLDISGSNSPHKLFDLRTLR